MMWPDTTCILEVGAEILHCNTSEYDRTADWILEISNIQISYSFIQLYCFRQACLYNAHPEPMKGSKCNVADPF